MKTDRELLELAAKAAGVLASPDGEYGWRGLKLANGPNHYWNPLADDGDAMRLATNLNMSVEISDYEGSTHVYVGEVPRVYACELWLDDKYAATRRAIVRAAAGEGVTC